MTADEYIAYLTRRIAELEESLDKAMHAVRAAETQAVCPCCSADVKINGVYHFEDCPILWLRHRGLR